MTPQLRRTIAEAAYTAMVARQQLEETLALGQAAGASLQEIATATGHHHPDAAISKSGVDRILKRKKPKT